MFDNLREPESPGTTTECATRWHDAGREVSIVRSVMGSDLNDAVMAIGA
jgi:hypothetical protein